MAGQEVLGRLVNVIPIAAGKPFRLRNASVAMITVTGAAAQPTLNQRTSFGGADTALPVIKTVYWATATDGTAVWNKLILPNFVSTYIHGTTAGLTTATCTVFHVFTSQLVDPSAYLNVVSTAGPALVSVTVGDLTVQRGPASLEVLGA